MTLILVLITILLLCTISLGISIDDVLKKSTKTRPRNGERGPLQVHIGFYLESIGNFRSTEMSFDVDLYVYMSWKDSRLSHNHSDHVLINDINIRNQMWLPDLYFANARQAHFQDVTVPNFNMFVSNDGTVAYSCRATCSISCSLQLINYPMDKQRCKIKVLSYAHVAEQVTVHWFSSKPIAYNPEIGLPEFRIINVSEGYCKGEYRYALTEKSHSLGNFSCLTGNIYLSRSIGYNLVQSYIPTGLIVMISWVSFWIDRRAVPARVTLSFTTLVSLTTLGNGLRFGLPQVSYAKAIDLWYGACMFFVFCALLEFALINSFMRKSEKYEHISKTFATSPRYQTLMEKLSTTPTMNGTGNIHSNGFGTRKRITNKGQNGHAQKNRESEPIMYRLDEVHRSPQRAPVLNGYSKTGHTNRLSSLFEESILDGKGIEDTHPFPNENGIAKATDIDSSFSAVSVYDNVTPTKKAQFEEIDPPLIDDESIDRKFRNYQNSLRRKSGVEGYSINTSAFYTTLSIEASRTALKIDKICRYLFPGAFCLFNAAYWWFYLVWEARKGFQDD